MQRYVVCTAQFIGDKCFILTNIKNKRKLHPSLQCAGFMILKLYGSTGIELVQKNIWFKSKKGELTVVSLSLMLSQNIALKKSDRTVNMALWAWKTLPPTENWTSLNKSLLTSWLMSLDSLAGALGISAMNTRSFWEGVWIYDEKFIYKMTNGPWLRY